MLILYVLRNVICMLCDLINYINCNTNTLLFPNNLQLLDKINTDTEMDDIVQDYNAVSLFNI